MTARELVLAGIGLLCVPLLAPAQGWDTPDEPGRSKLYLSLMGGTLDGEDNPGRLEGEGGEASLGFGFGYRPRPHLALEGELFMLDRTYAAPPPEPFPLYAQSERMEVTSAGFLFTAKGTMHLKRAHPYAGVGFGIYHSEAIVREVFFIIPGEQKESDIGLGTHVAAGVDFAVGERWTVGIEARELRLSADFGHLSGDEVDIGGRSILITGRRSL
jgi:opacity protein-like surface antigen